MSIMFDGCNEVYPCLICRPEVRRKSNMKNYFEAYLGIFLDKLVEANVSLDKAVADAPERARLKAFKTYGGYFSCDWCLANPENISIEGRRGSKCDFYLQTRNTLHVHVHMLAIAKESNLFFLPSIFQVNVCSGLS